MSFLRPSATKQTTSSIGTGTLALNVNSGDTRSFQTAMGSGPIKGRFMLRGQGYFEMFRGTFTAPSTLTRDEPLISSNANALVSIPAGTTDVYLLDYAQFVVDSFSGSKTLTNSDIANTWVFTGSGASALTLPAISASLPDFWGFIRNAGTANLTLTAPGSDVIDETGTQTAVFAPNDSGFLYLDTANTKWRIVRGGTKVPTQQKLTSGSGATYNTPIGVRQLRIRMIGGGGGGGGASAATVVGGSNGGFTSFDNASANVKAVGGVASPGGASGYGSTPGTGTANNRVIGNAGTPTSNGLTGSIPAGTGGGSQFGGSPGLTSGTTQNGASAQANSGAGGSGAIGSNGNCGGGGQAGEYVELIINNPAASYTYTIGAGGAGGVSTNNGGAGGSGVIIVDEIY
jgi:hypothetical protein